MNENAMANSIYTAKKMTDETTDEKITAYFILHKNENHLKQLFLKAIIQGQNRIEIGDSDCQSR